VPFWAWIVLVAGVIALAAGATLGGIYAYRAAERRLLLQLVRSREGLEFVRQALGDSLVRIAEGSEQELRVFADDPDSVERRALAEVASRARLLADELDVTALPKSLIPAGEALADAAFVIAREAGRVGEDAAGDAAIEALGCIDLEAVEQYYRAAVSAVRSACETCGLEDSAVYGGGLYL